MKPLGNEYKAAEASTGNEFVKLPAGGYVCVIKKVEDVSKTEKPYLRVVYDIKEGDYANYYSDDWGKDNEWAHEVRQYYTPAAFRMFKGFLKSVDESNGTNFEEQAEQGLDEQKLVGTTVGYIIGEEEYRGNDGSIKTRLRVRGARSVWAIREGRFKAPEIKRLEESIPAIEPTPVTDADLPF